MIGRDFTSTEEFLCDDAWQFLQTRGEDSFVVHNSLSKMYFESIWNVDEIQKMIQSYAKTFQVDDGAEQESYFYQMLFDLVSFYNMGNANQLYNVSIGQWEESDIFENNLQRTNNMNISAFLYVEYFYSLLSECQDSFRLRHLMFVNSFVFGKGQMEETDFLNKLDCLIDNEDLYWSFYNYAKIITADFYFGTTVEKSVFREFVQEEVLYFRTISKDELKKYMQYIKQTKCVIEECETCADRQNNYGLVETEFKGLMQAVL